MEEEGGSDEQINVAVPAVTPELAQALYDATQERELVSSQDVQMIAGGENGFADDLSLDEGEDAVLDHEVESSDTSRDITDDFEEDAHLFGTTPQQLRQDECFAKLLDMGFDTDVARAAAEQADGDVDAAMRILVPNIDRAIVATTRQASANSRGRAMQDTELLDPEDVQASMGEDRQSQNNARTPAQLGSFTRSRRSTTRKRRNRDSNPGPAQRKAARAFNPDTDKTADLVKILARMMHSTLPLQWLLAIVTDTAQPADVRLQQVNVCLSRLEAKNATHADEQTEDEDEESPATGALLDQVIAHARTSKANKRVLRKRLAEMRSMLQAEVRENKQVQNALKRREDHVFQKESRITSRENEVLQKESKILKEVEKLSAQKQALKAAAPAPAAIGPQPRLAALQHQDTAAAPKPDVHVVERKGHCCVRARADFSAPPMSTASEFAAGAEIFFDCVFGKTDLQDVKKLDMAAPVGRVSKLCPHQLDILYSFFKRGGHEICMQMLNRWHRDLTHDKAKQRGFLDKGRLVFAVCPYGLVGSSKSITDLDCIITIFGKMIMKLRPFWITDIHPSFIVGHFIFSWGGLGPPFDLPDDLKAQLVPLAHVNSWPPGTDYPLDSLLMSGFDLNSGSHMCILENIVQFGEPMAPARASGATMLCESEIVLARMKAELQLAHKHGHMLLAGAKAEEQDAVNARIDQRVRDIGKAIWWYVTPPDLECFYRNLANMAQERAETSTTMVAEGQQRGLQCHHKTVCYLDLTLAKRLETVESTNRQQRPASIGWYQVSKLLCCQRLEHTHRADGRFRRERPAKGHCSICHRQRASKCVCRGNRGRRRATSQEGS